MMLDRANFADVDSVVGQFDFLHFSATGKLMRVCARGVEAWLPCVLIRHREPRAGARWAFTVPRWWAAQHFAHVMNEGDKRVLHHGSNEKEEK